MSGCARTARCSVTAANGPKLVDTMAVRFRLVAHCTRRCGSRPNSVLMRLRSMAPDSRPAFPFEGRCEKSVLTLSPRERVLGAGEKRPPGIFFSQYPAPSTQHRSEEHTSELQ